MFQLFQSAFWLINVSDVYYILGWGSRFRLKYSILKYHSVFTHYVFEFVLLLTGHMHVFYHLISDEETFAGLVQQDLSSGTRAQWALRGSDQDVSEGWMNWNNLSYNHVDRMLLFHIPLQLLKKKKRKSVFSTFLVLLVVDLFRNCWMNELLVHNIHMRDFFSEPAALNVMTNCSSGMKMNNWMVYIQSGTL